MTEEEKDDKNLEELNQYLFTIFEQSWEYIRHAQTMFWQSFTAIFTVIMGILFFSYDKNFEVQIAGIISSLALSMVGFFVVVRIIVVLREHFVTINRIRKYCGIDEKEVILRRWRKSDSYDVEKFRVWRPETIYIVLVNQIYIVIFSVLVWYLSILFIPGLFAAIFGILFGVLLEVYAWTEVYRGKEEKSVKDPISKKKGSGE